MKRLKKITADTQIDTEVELYDLDRVAAKLEKIIDEVEELRYDYRKNSLMTMILNEVISGVEKSRFELVKDVQNNYDRDEYKDMDHLYWRIDK